MPADYSSTARALALPVSPSRSPTIPKQSKLPQWSRRQSGAPLLRHQSPEQEQTSNVRDQIIDSADRALRRLNRIVEKLTPIQRALAIVAGIATFVLGILFLVFNEKIFAKLEPVAVKWKDLRGGWLILWAMTFLTAFPPIIGYSTCLTIAGFVYGFPEGWFIVATATVVGSTCSFLVSRTILSNFVHRLVANDTRFAALSLVLKHDGLKLLCMIRLCPLPYSISNGAISTFPTVQPSMYALATAIVTPKLMVHIFIGSRLAAIAKSGEKMSAGTKAINWISIVGGMVVGVVTGWYIYQRTVARSQQLEAEERNNAHRSTSQVPGAFTDDPEEQEAAATLLRDDQIDFLDTESSRGRYQDEFSDDDDHDPFRNGDGGDEQGGINLEHQPPHR